MNSWDVFDTLLTRRTLLPRDVPCPRAEQLFPIRENVLKVQPEDILISDMAEMPPEAVTALVREVTGLQNRVIVTRDGKATGRLWRELAANGRPGLHVGDNIQSDYIQPMHCGISAELYSGAALSEAETDLLLRGFVGLAMACREARLSTFHPAHRDIELVQTQINFPLLYLAALALRPHLTGRRVLASARDCWLWQGLLRKLTGADVVYWHTSRLARAFPTREYLEYTEALMAQDCHPERATADSSFAGGRTQNDKAREGSAVVLLDLVGTGWSLRRIASELALAGPPPGGAPRPALQMLAWCGGQLEADYESLRSTSGEVRWLIASGSQGLEHHNLAPHAMVSDVTAAGSTYWNPTGYDWEGSPEIAAQGAAFAAAEAALEHYGPPPEIPVEPQLLQHLIAQLPEAPWLPREDRFVQEELKRRADASH